MPFTKEQLLQRLPQIGTLTHICVRPSKGAPIRLLSEVVLNPAVGIVGDHYAGRSGKRQVTLLQAEHLPVVAALLGLDALDPARLRRNLIVSGINLLALRDRKFQIGGEVVLQGTGACHPCSKMEENLGPGGYNAMRGHGGITARVIVGGHLRTGEPVQIIAGE